MPDWKRYVREHLPPLGVSGAREEEVIEELAQQLEGAYQEALSRAASESEAAARAEAQSPDWTAVAREIALAEQPLAAKLPQRWVEQMRDSAWGKRTKGNIMGDFLDDLRFAVRLLGKTPLFAAVVVLMLALGIGANTAIFSLVDAVMLRSLPVRDSQELVLLSWAARKPPKFRGYSSYGDCGIPRAFRGANPHGC